MMKPRNNEVCAGFQSMVSETEKKDEPKKALKTAFSLGAKVLCSYE